MNPRTLVALSGHLRMPSFRKSVGLASLEGTVDSADNRVHIH